MMNSSSPTPPVAFQNHCSIIHDNILYVYQPDAFQVIELTKGAEWKNETNGVSVTGAVCVKGGIDGDSTKPALYVVGGTTNSLTANYTGIQRYSIADKNWTTITPLVSVTAQRRYHGATYLNTSSSILVYGGSRDGNAGPSTETFLMLMYPPYRIQSYSSVAPPVVNPTLLSWDEDQAIMVGGSTTNQKIFKFHPDPGWVDLGLTLPEPLPDTSVAQSSLVTLDDNSKILLTYDMSQSPNTVQRTVVLNAGNLPATFNETVGTPTSSAAATSSTAARMFKRSIFLNTYPTYNSSSASTITRTDFALALGQNDLTAVVGGDSGDTVEFFNQLQNRWRSPSDYFGVQQPLRSSASSSSSTATPTPTVSPSHTLSSSPSVSVTPAAVPESNSSNGLTILGGVLGGICGLAAILIIFLLYLRNVRRSRRMAEAEKNKQYSEDKPSFEEQGLQPLSRQAQPMGRSPVTSAVVEDRDSLAMFGPKTEKPVEPGVPAKTQLGVHHNGSGIGFGFKREKSPLTISKPMMPDLGDYQVQPSIELGKATPVTPVVAVDTGLVTALPSPSDNPKANQRKTDEGWAKYFSAEREGDRRDTTLTTITDNSQAPVPTRTGQGGFWPGSGVPQPSTRSPAKNPLRDSEGRHLTAQKVATNSPNLTNGTNDVRTHTMSTAEGIEAKISSGDSISTSVTDEYEYEDDYEDEKMTVYSSGVPESVHETIWTPVGNTWSGPPQRPLRPPSVQVGAHDFPPPPNMPVTTSNAESTKSSLPNFPMPATTTRRLQPSGPQIPGLSIAAPPPIVRDSTGSSNYGPRIASEDYFNRSIHLATTVTPQPEAPRHQRGPSQPAAQPTDPSDMSWINLGTPAAGTPAVGAPMNQLAPPPQAHPSNQ